MVFEAVVCKQCGQTRQVKLHRRTGYGTTRAGTQRYRCYDCGQTAPADLFVQTYTHKARDPLVKEQITKMVLNGAGVRDVARVLGINRNTVSAPFKK
ncbi:MAG: hypothetical protein JWP57_1057 [Spirosoma sp.]|nr:hypothetical protein [Spirosoma sp.]